MEQNHEFFASCISGTEEVLCDELRELKIPSVRLNRGGIPFRGEWRDGWRACLESRIAQRIQLLLARFPCPDEDALYKGIRGIAWEQYITPQKSFAVSAVLRASKLTHSGFAALKVKDAIVDHIRDRENKRPSVDRDDPDVRVFLYVANDKATVYLDMSGESLHIRGYRAHAVEAPLRETLAAALLRMSGWDRKTPLMDPMCGSGTIAIEAALWAISKAPNLDRKRFGFERWANFGATEADAMRELRGQLRSEISGTSPRIQASDIDPAAIEIAQKNARTAGVRLSFKQRSLFETQFDGGRHLVIFNPPYGERLEADQDFIRKTAAAVSRMHGWRVCILAGSPDYERMISAKPEAVIPIKNGDIPCDFLVYEID